MENNRKINRLMSIFENMFSKSFVWLQKSYLYLGNSLIGYPQVNVDNFFNYFYEKRAGQIKSPAL